MRVLILEDELLVAFDLQHLLERSGHEVIAICGSVAAMEARLGSAPDFAFLDIDLPDGKSFGLAGRLQRAGIPFAFVSGSRQSDLPEHLRQARFVAKPYSSAAIRNVLNMDERLAG